MKIVIAMALMFILPAAQATPGRLNDKGCHNSKTAGYHCHGATVNQKQVQPIKKKG